MPSADEVADRALNPCKERDHRRWHCHYARGHKGEHAFTDADEMRHMRQKLDAIQARLESGKSYRLAQDIQAILEDSETR